MASLKVGLKVRMSRNYGTTTVEFELSAADVEIDGQSIQADLLTSKIIANFAHFEEQTLKQLGKSAKPAVEYNELKVPATKLYYQLKEGKRSYRVACGQWSKFGVSIYPEVMEKCNINPKEIPEDGHEFPKGTFAIVQLENGEPKRVINLVTT